MSHPSSDRSRNSSRDGVEPLAYRIACLLFGIAFIAVPFLVRNDPALQNRLWLAALLVLMAVVGAAAFLFAVLSSDRMVSSAIDRIGDFEVGAILFVIATPIAWLIRKARRS